MRRVGGARELHFPGALREALWSDSISQWAPRAPCSRTTSPGAPRGLALHFPQYSALGRRLWPSRPQYRDSRACSLHRGRCPRPDGLVVVPAAARWTAPRSPSRWLTWCSPCASCSRPPSSTRPGSRYRTCCRAGWAARTPPSCPITCAAQPPPCCATRCCRWVRRPTPPRQCPGGQRWPAESRPSSGAPEVAGSRGHFSLGKSLGRVPDLPVATRVEAVGHRPCVPAGGSWPFAGGRNVD